MIARLFCGAALLGVICSPALAQVTTIGKDGQAANGAMPTDAKMLKMMHKQAHAVKGTVMVWMDEKGHMMMCDCRDGNDRK